MNSNLFEVRQVLEFSNKLVSQLDYYVNHSIEHFFELRKEQLIDKLIAETSLLLLLANRISHRVNLSPLILEIAVKSEKYARRASHLHALSNNPQTVVGIGLPHVVLEQLGMHDELYNQAINEALSSKYSMSIDRPNFRQMEMKWLQGLNERVTPDFSDLARNSLLTKDLHPVYMRREDAYAATHAVMYLTNFGETDLDDNINLKQIESFIEHSTSWCIAYSDWDLLAEILLVKVLARCKETEFSIFASSVLRFMFKRQGIIYGPNFDRNAYNLLSDNKKEAYSFMQCYHTTYVYGILRILELTYSVDFTATSNQTALLNNIADDPEPEMADIQIFERVTNNELLGWLISDGFIENSGSSEVLLNARLIYLSREEVSNKLLTEIQIYENSGKKRLRETCEVASEKFIQLLRARAYLNR